VWSVSGGIKSTFTIWQPSFGEFFLVLDMNKRAFYIFHYYTIDEGVQKSGLVSIQIWKGYVRK
jgi:hypothetical protein